MITGRNGAGKTSVLEAVAYLSTLQSFRDRPAKPWCAEVRTKPFCGPRPWWTADRSPSKPSCRTRAGRGRMVNRQTVRRRSDLHDALRTTVFSPEDIGVVRSGPAERRRFLDDTLAVVDPKAARAAEDVEQILRQRSALLRTSGRKLGAEVASTLDVWDQRLDAAGTSLVEAREGWSASWRRSPRPTIHGWPVGDGRDPRLPALVVGQLLDALAQSRSKDLDGGFADRTPPGRTRVVAPRAPRPDPRLPGRTTVVGPGPPAGRPPTGHRAAGDPRCSCSTTSSPSSTLSGPRRCWPDCPRARPS